MSADIRVLILTPDYPPSYGGIQLLLHQIAVQMEHARVRVLTLDTSGEDAPRNVDVVRVRTGHLRTRRAGIVSLNLQAPMVAARFRPDVVLSGHIVCAPGAWLIRKTLQVPYVQYLHGVEVAHRPALGRFALERAAAAIAVSRHTEELALGLLGSATTRVHRIPPGVHLPARIGTPRGDGPVVLTISRMAERYKGHDVMIRALPLIRARVPQAMWVVVGDGPLRPTWEGMARAIGQTAAVRFLGIVDDVERDHWLDRASVFALLSRPMPNGGGEGFGIVFLEAAAHRLPVVAARSAGILDSVVDGVTGLLVDPLDHVCVADAISRLLLNPGRAAAMGGAAALHAQNYRWDQVSRRVREVLVEATSLGPR